MVRRRALSSVEDANKLVRLAEERVHFFNKISRFHSEPDVKLVMNDIIALDNEIMMMLSEMNTLDDSIMKLSKHLSGRSLRNIKVFLNIDESRLPPMMADRHRKIKIAMQRIGMDNPKEMLAFMESQIKAFDIKIRLLTDRIDSILATPLVHEIRMEVDETKNHVDKLKDYYSDKSSKWISALERAAAEI